MVWDKITNSFIILGKVRTNILQAAIVCIRDCFSPFPFASCRVSFQKMMPLQELFIVAHFLSLQGIYDDMNLGFYLVAYDDIGGIACRRIWNSPERFASYGPVFWTSNTTFVESPFSVEEENLYDSRVHLQPLAEADSIDGIPPLAESNVVSRILFINSSFDLVIPHLSGTTANPQGVEGRIWQYGDGTFGFGFLRDNFIVDLRHVSKNGCLLDAIEFRGD